MSKRKKIILFVILVGVVIGGMVSSYFLYFKKSTGEKTQDKVSDQKDADEKQEVVGEETYEDEVGFSFNYPKDFKVKDATPDDNVSYSLLELSDSVGKITIWVFDIKEKSIEDWIKGSSKYKGATLAGAITLAGLSAKQYEIGDNFLTLAFKDGVIYLIEGPKDDKWVNIQNAVIESFSIQGLGSSSSPSDSTIYEEEVVE